MRIAMGHILTPILRSFWRSADTAVRRRWNRHLPFADYVVDRWERARRIGFGEGTSIYDSSLVLGDVQVGRHTWIGPFTILDGSGGGLRIGSYCSVSAGVQIYTHDSVQWAASGGAASYAQAPTVIGDRCYIGPQTVVAKGVTIGDGAIIGAHSLVLDDIPANSKAVGCPARVIGPSDGLTDTPAVALSDKAMRDFRDAPDAC